MKNKNKLRRLTDTSMEKEDPDDHKDARAGTYGQDA